MSPSMMLPTSTSTTLNSTLPKLTADGSNWIIWKMRMQVFLGAKKFAQYLDGCQGSYLPLTISDVGR